jgi:hypothetical protein
MSILDFIIDDLIGLKQLWEEFNRPAQLAQQGEEYGMMEAACPPSFEQAWPTQTGWGHPASIHAIFQGAVHASAAGSTRQ